MFIVLLFSLGLYCLSDRRRAQVRAEQRVQPCHAMLRCVLLGQSNGVFEG
jgi:hypothetical protein